VNGGGDCLFGEVGGLSAQPDLRLMSCLDGPYGHMEGQTGSCWIVGTVGTQKKYRCQELLLRLLRTRRCLHSTRVSCSGPQHIPLDGYVGDHEEHCESLTKVLKAHNDAQLCSD
jgi:hypothetical protein